MNAISPLRDDLFTPRNLTLIRRTVAADTNDAEFDLFVHMCRHLKLDPLRRQIYAFVFSKKDASKRRMSVVVAIDGLRTIAARSGDYRPDEDEPTYEFDDSVKGPLNPAGLVKATVRVWKHAHGNWHRVTASAYWDEYAPISDEWAYDDEKGRRAPTGRQVLDSGGNWPKMPRLMLAKVAEALALRKAWPDDMSNVYASEELDRARTIDASPSEMAEIGESDARISRIGGPGIIIDWMDDNPLSTIPIGQIADRCIEWLRAHAAEPSTVGLWQSRNRDALRQFWAHSENDALEVKRAVERIIAGGAA